LNILPYIQIVNFENPGQEKVFNHISDGNYFLLLQLLLSKFHSCDQFFDPLNFINRFLVKKLNCWFPLRIHCEYHKGVIFYFLHKITKSLSGKILNVFINLLLQGPENPEPNPLQLLQIRMRKIERQQYSWQYFWWILWWSLNPNS